MDCINSADIIRHLLYSRCWLGAGAAEGTRVSVREMNTCMGLERDGQKQNGQFWLSHGNLGDVTILGLCSSLAYSEKQVMVTQGGSKVIFT